MGWKIYFWIFTISTVAGTALLAADSMGILFPEQGPVLDETWTWLDLLATLIVGISLVGLFGFAYKKVLGKQSFWKRWFIFVLVFDISYTFSGFYHEGFDADETWLSVIMFSLLIAFFIPYYVALYLYGYKSDSLWNPQSSLLQ